LTFYTGVGSISRRKDLVARRLATSSIFLELKGKIKREQAEATQTFMEQLTMALEYEFEKVEKDIQNVVCHEGVVSEARRYPGTATQVKDLVNGLSTALESSQALVEELRSVS
jgi:hypothetical protein